MARGFVCTFRPTAPPDLRLLPFDGDPAARPSLVSVAYDPADGSLALVLGRVMYRSDLTERLPHPVPLGDADADLVLGVYRQLGANGLEMIEGELAAVVWDGRRRHGWGWRDPFGCWPL